MAALLESTYEFIPAASKQIIEVSLDPTGLTKGQQDTAFADFLDTNYNGWTATDTTLTEICEVSNYWLGKKMLALLRTMTERINADGTITRVYTITQP